jgi:hypothetical protein
VVGLGGIERLQRFDGSRRGFVESVGVIDLRDGVARDPRLFSVDRKDGRTILRTSVRPLAIDFRRVVLDSSLSLLHAASGLKVSATPFMQ